MCRNAMLENGSQELYKEKENLKIMFGSYKNEERK